MATSLDAKKELHQVLLAVCAEIGKVRGPAGYFERLPLVEVVAELAEAVQPLMDDFLWDHLIVKSPTVLERVIGAVLRKPDRRSATALCFLLQRSKGMAPERIEPAARALLVYAQKEPARYECLKVLFQREAGADIHRMMLPLLAEHPIPHREWTLREWAFGPDPELRLTARRTLARIAGASMREDLRRMVKMDRDQEVRYHASRTLMGLGDPLGRQGLEELLREGGRWAPQAEAELARANR